MELVVGERGVIVRKYQGRLRVERDKERLQEVPLLMLNQVIIASNGVAITSDVVRVCCEHGIPIHFVGGNGRGYGMFYTAGLTGTIQTRRAQLDAYKDNRGATLARAFVRGKLENQINLLRAMVKNRREHDPQCFDEVQCIVAEIRDALLEAEAVPGNTCDELRPYLLAAEGRGADRYWAGIRRLLLCDLKWPGRRTQGASDPLNAAINYGYGILYAQVERALLLAGLDQYGGYLHTDRPGKPSLELDLIEEFRQPVVDRTILGLVNRGFDVTLDDHGRIDEPTRRRLAEHVLKRLDSTDRYEGKRQRLGVILQSQARHLATFVRGERPAYDPFVASW
jgi:CRISPR-associated protein Cas1